MAKGPRSGPYICGIDAALDVVSGKWKGLVLWELHAHGTRRFAELRRALPGVSEKMLTQHLRQMEEDGLVHRKVYAEVPPKVEYSLTDAGTSLNEALRPLGEWGRERLRRERLEVTDIDTPQTVAPTTS
ncbi:winged helix-turn-helix transcriptional regulator [Nocardia sp. alder85J]|uniref:winged helix-turn-helix transcriptional regulator n=1 Tax=Nocardia sp. alder85J TaxID=2862949 RepID=UPI001CD3CADD|nr:helix-turn-helix domain-containing protein [Nocardia sp. alder85J]MCX4091789.1 helix-turn-helix domain-containing protein [Nocardia sp. alder85J]